MADTLGARLKALRLKAGLSVEQLARAAGISRITVHRFEAGMRHPSWPALQSLSAALGADLGSWEGLKRPPPPA